MSCGHCRSVVDKALNSLEGIRAILTLDPPISIVEFDDDKVPLPDLQLVVSKAGNFRLIAT